MLWRGFDEGFRYLYVCLRPTSLNTRIGIRPGTPKRSRMHFSKYILLHLQIAGL
jgi:hypothetical protein